MIPEEIASEQALIDARYADPHPLMFPAAVGILVPPAGPPRGRPADDPESTPTPPAPGQDEGQNSICCTAN